MQSFIFSIFICPHLITSLDHYTALALVYFPRHLFTSLDYTALALVYFPHTTAPMRQNNSNVDTSCSSSPHDKLLRHRIQHQPPHYSTADTPLTCRADDNAPPFLPRHLRRMNPKNKQNEQTKTNAPVVENANPHNVQPPVEPRKGLTALLWPTSPHCSERWKNITS